MEFKVVTPHGVTYEDNVEKVSIPTMAGDIEILENHAALVSVLAPGELVIHKDDHTVNLAVSGGIIEMRPTGELYILADTAERAEDIDVERADAARKRAQELLKQQKNVADVDFARIQAMIEKETVRLSVGNKYRG